MIPFILFSCVFVFFVLCLALEGWKLYIYQTKLKNLVFERGTPILGHINDLRKCDNITVLDFPKRMKEKYNVSPDVNGAFGWMGPILMFFSSNPDTLELILNSDKALKKAYLYGFLRNSKGIFTSEPKTWKLQRRALNPTVGPKMVKSFIPIFNEKFNKMVDLMDRQVGQPIDLYLSMFQSTTDVVFQSSFDVNWLLQNKFGKEFRETISGLFERVQLRIHSVLMKPDLIYKRTNLSKMDDKAYDFFHRFVKSALETKKIDLAEKLEHGIDELQIVKETNSANYLQKCLLLEMENKFSERDVLEEMETILVGSIDTSSLTVNGIMLMLAIHQEYQERVVEELRSIFSDPNEPVTSDHIPQMKFLELVIKESLRHFPIAPFIAREATEDIPFAGGFIPQRTQIFMCLLELHKSPKYWGENVNEFYPERFLPENSANYHPYQYIPFSAGSRNCIGMRYAWTSLKIAVAYLLRRYRFTTPLRSVHEIKIRAGLIMKIINKDALFIERRKW